MSDDRTVPITPETRVAALLDAYPEIEKVLMDAAPPFRRLANPVLRRTIARVTTLARAAEVAGMPARELVSRLREAVGQVPLAEPEVDAATSEERPAEWVDAARVGWTVDADAMLEQGTHPIAEVQRRAAALSGEELGVIRSSFRPAPLIELLESQGFRTAVVRSGDRFATFVGRAPA